MRPRPAFEAECILEGSNPHCAIPDGSGCHLLLLKSMLNDSRIERVPSTLVSGELTSSQVLSFECVPIMPPNHLPRRRHEGSMRRRKSEKEREDLGPMEIRGCRLGASQCWLSCSAT